MTQPFHQKVLQGVKAVVLAAGTGSRLRPLTDRVPKCLVPVGGRPMLDYWMDAVTDAGVRDVLVNTHHLPEQVHTYIDSVNHRNVLRVCEAFEPHLRGSAGTLTANAAFADDADEIIIIYADNLSDVDLRQMLAFHRSHGDPFTMLLFHAPNPRACGIASLDDQCRIVAFEEKPANPTSDLANAGVYVISAAAWKEIVGMRAFDIGRDVLPRFIGRARGWAGAGYHLDVGTPEAYERAQVDARGLLARRGFDADGRRPAVFLDRDGTLIEHVHYLSKPSQVRLLPGAAAAVERLRGAGLVCVLVTNQSAIGRGTISESELHGIHDEMLRQLAASGAALDAIYFCPEVPQGKDRTIVDHPDRKPGPGMLLSAAADLFLDLRSSWIVGDMISDVLSGRNARCLGAVLLRCGQPLADAEMALAGEFAAAADLSGAADLIIHRYKNADKAIENAMDATGAQIV